jgi:AraC-like DNA-binding protein
MMSPTCQRVFKNKFTCLREYVLKAKIKLVEIRLLNSDYTLTEIADELGFTDESPLKTFKRYVGKSIREFKNEGEYKLLKRNVPQANFIYLSNPF